MTPNNQGGLPFFFRFTGHIDRTQLLELLAQKLDRDLEAITAKSDSSISGLHFMDRNDALGVDFFTYVRASVGSGTTEAEQAVITRFQTEFQDYVARRARSAGRDFTGKDAPIGKPGILDKNTYGIIYIKLLSTKHLFL